MLLHIDLANSKRDEANPDIRYGKRHARMQAYVAEQKPTVLCVKELRACLSEDGSEKLTHERIMSDLAGAANLRIASMVPTCATPLPNGVFDPFFLGQAYDADKLFLLRMSCSVVEESNMPSLSCCYAPKTMEGAPDLSRQFWVISVHFPLPNNAKLECAKTLSSLLQTHPPGARLIAVGDFNLFQSDPDREAIWQTLHQGTTRSLSRMLDAANQSPLHGTFFPFLGDPMSDNILLPHAKAPSDASSAAGGSGDADARLHSRLDYVFHNSVLAEDAPILFTNDSDLPSDKRLSDHLPFRINLPMLEA